jgi:hypothetical protein
MLPGRVVRRFGPDSLKMYCPAFDSIFGAFLGKEYLHILDERHPDAASECPPDVCVSRIYGFRVLERHDSPEELASDP